MSSSNSRLLQAVVLHRQTRAPIFKSLGRTRRGQKVRLVVYRPKGHHPRNDVFRTAKVAKNKPPQYGG